MPGQTSRYRLPFPLINESPRGPAALQALAAAVDTAVGDAKDTATGARTVADNAWALRNTPQIGALGKVWTGAFYDNLAQSGLRKLGNGNPDPAYRVWTADRQVIGECAVDGIGRNLRYSVDVTGEFGAQDSGTRFDFTVRLSNATTGAILARLICTGTRKDPDGMWMNQYRSIQSGPSATAFASGNTKVFLVAERVVGSSVGELSSYSQKFVVSGWAA